MSAFQSYEGAYSFHGRDFRWRCYATARLHALRRTDHAPLPNPPQGMKWLTPSNSRVGLEVALLVDQDVDEISQILLQMEIAEVAQSELTRVETL
jgi:hypothetical protein